MLFKGKIYEAQNAIRHANGRDFNYYFFESKIKSNIKGDTIILHKFIITPESIYKINNEIFFTADIDIDIFYYYAILLFNSNFGFAYFAPYLQRRDNGVMKLSFNRKNADLIIDSIITKLTKSEWFGTAIGLSKNGIISAHRKMNLDTFEEIISHYNLLNDSLIIIDTIYGLAIGLINPMHSDSLFYLLMHGNRNLDNGEVYSDIYKYDLNTKNFRKFTIRDKRFWGDVLFTNYTPHDLRPELEIGFKHQLLACNDTCYGGQRIAFTDTSCCHFYRIWDFGDGTVSDTLWVTQHAELLNKVDTFQTVTHAYARPGRYKVTLQILNPYDYGEHLPPGQFLKDTLEKWIDVPFCSKADFTSQSSCNQTVTILDKHCGGYDSLMYDYGDGSPLTTSNTHTYAQPGVYYVTQILKLDTFVSRFTSPVIVPDCIYPDISLNDTLCVFDTLKIVYNGTSNYDTLWYSVEPIQGVKDIRQNLVSFERSGEYRLWLHAANTTFDTTWVYPNAIVVLDCDELWIPNAFTPNHDGINDVFSYVCRNCVWHSLEIFNRDTQPIFRCEGSEACVWLGKTEKGFVSEGVYVYRLKVRKRDGKIVERVGTVTVMK
ncbi:MAG: hypothetical protein KatS3mg035_1371 [Bacteroidia bacterium]|nr:MAG: hypothetical protein KatS3mg035_1371 [Bacteroidia bacterium]